MLDTCTRLPRPMLDTCTRLPRPTVLRRALSPCIQHPASSIHTLPCPSPVALCNQHVVPWQALPALTLIPPIVMLRLSTFLALHAYMWIALHAYMWIALHAFMWIALHAYIYVWGTVLNLSCGGPCP